MGVKVDEVGTGHGHSFHIPTPSRWDRADLDRVVGAKDIPNHPGVNGGQSCYLEA
ncbi:hypothetical protein KB1_11350 [Cutibacterium modestum]|uniref:Uncharacterized protein n=1 Tax=Cutibacterium modestum TaxID=2559073 RepID=A0AAD1NVJ1_9ACTN|nr:hypothetical protein KB1_11350 [Cutibacterium modestum]